VQLHFTPRECTLPLWMDSSAVTIPATSGKCSRSWKNLSASVEWPNPTKWPPWRCFCVRNEAVFLTGVDYPVDGGFMNLRG
jgi:hypothetical protein